MDKQQGLTIWESPEINHKILLAWATLHLGEKVFLRILHYFHDPKGLKKNQCSKFSHWVMISSKSPDYLVPVFPSVKSRWFNPCLTHLRKGIRWDKVCVVPPLFLFWESLCNLVCRLTGIPVDQLRLPVSLDILFWCLVCFPRLKYLICYTHCFLKIVISACSPKPVKF